MEKVPSNSSAEQSKELDPSPLGESSSDIDEFDPEKAMAVRANKIKEMGEQDGDNPEVADDNPNKEQYLEEIKEVEAKLNALQEEYSLSLDDADMYFNVIDKLLNDNRASADVIREELNKLEKAVAEVENRGKKLAETNEELGDYLKLDDGFLTPEEKGTLSDKYFNNLNARQDFIKLMSRADDLQVDASKVIRRR